MPEREAVKVIVRCRPMNERERKLNCKACINVDSNRAQIQITRPNGQSDAPKSFTFDGAFGIDSNTSQIYDDITYDLVEGVIEGYNGTVFAYGQTGCGKSFTMQGIESQRGIIPRAFQHIFESLAVIDDTKFLVRASYLEIYNEEVRDLLGKDLKAKLEVKESPDRGVFVRGISNHQVGSVSDCEVLMARGWKNRSTGETLMNKDSSRSHSIFTIHIEAAEKSDKGTKDKIRAGKLNLVDLAGSERQSKTGATGARLKEASKINLSLSALGNVISALVDGKSKHVPYRDSKLTRLLQDSLGGNTKTLMVACISPADNNYDETLSTLRYANRAKNIQNKPKINEDPKDALLRQYQEEIQKLKAMLEGKPVQQHEHPAMSTSGSDIDLEDEREKIRQELQKEFEEQIKALQTAQFQTNAPVPEGETQIAESDVIEKIQKKVQLIGGEKSNDSEAKERKKRRRRHADEQKKKIRQFADDDDDALIMVYEDINDKIRHQSVVMDKQKQRISNLKSEVADLSSEFETDRQMYLETFRKQEREIMLLQTILDRIQPTIRRDCNFYHLHKIKDQSQWDGEKWILPKMQIIKESLPGLNGNIPGNPHQTYRERPSGPTRIRTSPSRDDLVELERRFSQERISPPQPKARPFKLRPLK